MDASVRVDLTEQEVEQLLKLTQQGYVQAEGSLSQTDLVAYNRLLGKLHMARAEGMTAGATPKRKYTRWATKTAKKAPATKTGRKRGQPAKQTADSAAETTTEA
jgi:hypothetical protein